MSKPRKPNTTRKPPVPSNSHAPIEEWIRRQMPVLNPLVTHLDEQIRTSLAGLHYAVKWGKAYYGLADRGWIIEMAAYDVSVNVVFLGGADLEPPPPLGDTDRSRYIKLRTLEEARAPQISQWIKQAGRVPGWQ